MYICVCIYIHVCVYVCLCVCVFECLYNAYIGSCVCIVYMSVCVCERETTWFELLGHMTEKDSTGLTAAKLHEHSTACVPADCIRLQKRAG